MSPERKFLPAHTQDYAIPDPRPDHFTPGRATLLEDIGRKMNVARARTEGRIPSPFSRAFVFSLNLFGRGLGDGAGDDDDRVQGKGRQFLQTQARRTFRGLCAAFALRKALQLHVVLDSAEVIMGRNTFEDVLLPSIDSGPRGAEFWNPIRFYTVTQDERDRAEVLCGISPLSGIYPAAAPPGRLRSLFWYDADTGTWYDPTSDDLGREGRFRVSPATRAKVNGLMKAWIGEAVRRLQAPHVLEPFGLDPRDKKDLLDEFKLWLREIPGRPAEDVIPQEENGIPRSRKASPLAQSLPFLDHACEATAASIISDLPMHDETLLVTREQLLDQGTRLYGRFFGSAEFENAVDALPTYGDNLGLDLGFTDEHRMPIGYVFVDQLFVPNLTYLNETGFSNEWRGLEMENEYYLLPFEPDILRYLTPDELHANTSGRLTPNGEAYAVTLTFGDVAIQKSYDVSGQSRYSVDSFTIPADTFDIRVFPNVNVDALPPTYLADEDRTYYARVRLAPQWTFQIGPFHCDHDRETGDRGVRLDEGQSTRIGSNREVANEEQFAAGETLFITCDTAPDGFYVRGRGLCLLTLPQPNGTPEEWEVGIDFGTSNTCVAYKVGTKAARTLDFPVLTTTLFRRPSYNATFDAPYGGYVNERSAALLDFFYKRSETDASVLNQQEYFPTQIVTRQSHVQERVDWDFENGLVYFRNLGLTDSNDVKELIKDFGDYVRKYARAPRLPEVRFMAKQDIKWENTAWLETFMRHLRIQLLMTAAKENARVSRLTFSYPKAFSLGERDNFQGILRRVWRRELSPDRFLTSESEAVRNYIVRDHGQHVVFDVGGGTTDVIAFDRQHPIFQTSFKIAARQINQYVVASPRFRSAFLTAVKQVVTPAAFGNQFLKHEDEFVEEAPGYGESDSHVIETVWVGILENIERRDDGAQILHDVLSLLRTKSDAVPDEETERAVRGFFLSIVLLFSGLAFYAGTLLRAASRSLIDPDERAFTLNFVDLILTGNGGKLYRMIDHDTATFDRVIRAMTQAGIAARPEQVSERGNGEETESRASDDALASTRPPGPTTNETSDDRDPEPEIKFSGIYRNGGHAAPKSTVALGLLTNPEFGASGIDAAIPVANVVGEAGYSMDDDEVVFHGDVVDYYEHAATNRRHFTVPDQAPPYLTLFLDALNDVLPKGQNQGLSIVPGIGPDWNEPLKGELYHRSRRAIMTRVAKNASDLQQRLQRMTKDSVPALESLFVIELAALLDTIRDTYSAPGA